MQEEFKNQICLNGTKDELFGMPEQYDYSKFKDVEGFCLDDELINKFAPVAKKLNLSQSSVEMLMDVALEMSKRQNLQFQKDGEMRQQENMANYYKKFCDDSELPNPNSSQLRDYMRLADGAYHKFASAELQEAFRNSGLNYHPELIKMFHKIGSLAEEDNLSHYGRPAFEELTPAQILYGKND